MAARQPYAHPNDDFVQAGGLYRDVMSEEDRAHLVGNIVGHLSGARVARGLGLDMERRTP